MSNGELLIGMMGILTLSSVAFLIGWLTAQRPSPAHVGGECRTATCCHATPRLPSTDVAVLAGRIDTLEALAGNGADKRDDPLVHEVLEAVTNDLDALDQRVAQLEAANATQAEALKGLNAVDKGLHLRISALEKTVEELKAQAATTEQNARLAHGRITDLTAQITKLSERVKILTGSRPNWLAVFIGAGVFALVYTILAIMCHPGTFGAGWNRVVTDLIDQAPFIAIIGITGGVVGAIVSATLFRRPLEEEEV